MNTSTNFRNRIHTSKELGSFFAPFQQEEDFMISISLAQFICPPLPKVYIYLSGAGLILCVFMYTKLQIWGTYHRQFYRCVCAHCFEDVDNAADGSGDAEGIKMYPVSKGWGKYPSAFRFVDLWQRNTCYACEPMNGFQAVFENSCLPKTIAFFKTWWHWQRFSTCISYMLYVDTSKLNCNMFKE